MHAHTFVPTVCNHCVLHFVCYHYYLFAVILSPKIKLICSINYAAVILYNKCIVSSIDHVNFKSKLEVKNANNIGKIIVIRGFLELDK